MKRKFLYLSLIAGSLLLGSCFGQHNKAPSEGVNLDSKRVYGERGGEPMQLKNEYPAPTIETLERIDNIRTQLFPE